MNHTSSIILPILALALGAGGMKSSAADSAKESPITGKPSDPPIELKAAWKAGSRYALHLEENQTMQMNLGPRPTTSETTVMQDGGLEVTNAPDGRRGLDLELQALVVESYWGDRNVIRFDSLNKATPNEGVGVDLLKRVVGGHLGFLVDSSNQVVKVDGIKELMERAQGDIGTSAPDQRRDWMRDILQRIYNEDYFKQWVDLGALPGTSVRIGDSWTRQQEIDVGLVGRVLVTTTNTLRGWQQQNGKKCARFDISGGFRMKTDKAEGFLALLGLGVQDGRISGKAWFDPVLGLPIETSFEQKCTISGTLPNFGPPGAKNKPQTFSSPWRQTTSLTIVQSQPGADPQPKK